MPTPSKAKLSEKLRELGVEPPVGATATELSTLLKKRRALADIAPASNRAPAPAVPPPSTVAPDPVPVAAVPSVEAVTSTGAAPRSGWNELGERAAAGLKAGLEGRVETFVPTGRIAVPAAPRSDHDARAWDPFAGW